MENAPVTVIWKTPGTVLEFGRDAPMSERLTRSFGAKEEMKRLNEFDYVVVNHANHQDQAVEPARMVERQQIADAVSHQASADHADIQATHVVSSAMAPSEGVR
jgi:hypothetical protein